MKRLLTEERGIATFLVVILIVLSVVIVGIVATAAVILSNDVKITVNNQTSSTLDIAQGSAALKFNFLPGINVPAQIAPGDTAVVQVPKRFVNSFTITTNSAQVRAFGQTFTFGTPSIDMQRSTWDGTSLTGLVNRQIVISGNNTLVIVGR
jgi:hypothetical protein